ncbi:MAG: hypothetical protein Q8N02_01930 [Methylotenera sp.]|nr:hypothetical protein [Methylotenera sp.]MDO9233168.1 hypothetical protein [Methylotenera sp.]MDO9388281.1 hypothetical protein [Methylotenera sp.]MDP2101083.1 hypothetical protein [Methylotenera sp.]MDP2281732.1 hypothetical protein [Methylotenera sp.]
MKKQITHILLALTLLLNLNALADEASVANNNTNMLVYIQPVEYSNPISLWHPYRDYWFYQGPVVERLAMPRLTQLYGAVSLCESNQSANTLVWLQPRMFYNPQVQLFYSEVTANVYTGIGKLVGTYVGEFKQHGFLNIKPDYWIEKSYARAIDEMVAKMQADSALQTLINTPQASGTNATPCSMVTLLPTPRIRAMSF